MPRPWRNARPYYLMPPRRPRREKPCVPRGISHRDARRPGRDFRLYGVQLDAAGCSGRFGPLLNRFSRHLEVVMTQSVLQRVRCLLLDLLEFDSLCDATRAEIRFVLCMVQRELGEAEEGDE